MPNLRSATLALLLAALTPPAAAGAVIEREIRFAAGEVTLSTRDGVTEVSAANARGEWRAGHPDLPWRLVRIELEPGQRVTSVAALDVRTEPLADAVRLPAARDIQPGLEPPRRTPPDPAVFGSHRFLPAGPVMLGTQGAQRDEWMAFLEVCPVRWNPASGALERVVSLRVRLEVEDGLPVLRREREAGGTGARARRFEHDAARPADRPQPFSPTQLPSVEGSPVRFLIITEEEQVAQYQRLADWRTQSGIPTAVRTLSFVRSQYPSGSDDAERIRLFIRDAYTRWSTDFVLLGGDTEVLPTRYGFTTYYDPAGHYIANDLYFSCLDGNWNADGDSLYGEGYYDASRPGDACDLLPEVYIGRFPTVTAADAQRVVDKTLQYSKSPLGDYEHSALFFAEVLFPQNWLPGHSTWLDGAELIEYDLLDIFDLRPDVRYARLYENHADPRWRPGALPETRAIVVDSLNRGYNVAVHVGHGYRNVMSVGDQNMTNADAMGLLNGNRLMNLYATNCTSNAIDFPSIGEAFLLAPNGGAVTNLGSTTLDFPYAGRAYQENFFELVFRDSVSTVGEAQAKQKLEFVGFANSDNVHRWTQMTLLMLGDPALRIWTGTPRTLSVTHPAAIAASDSQFAVAVLIGATPLANATVTAWKPGVEYRIGVTDAAGQVVLPFRPDAAGSLTLTVTGYDCRPYQATVTITPAGAPVLAAGDAVIIDDNVDGKTGNEDARLDAGEVVDLRIPVANNGGSATVAVEGTLATADPWVTVDQPAVSYGTIAPAAVSNPAPGFRITVLPGAPDQREVAFTLTLLEGGVRTERAVRLVIHAAEPRHIGHVLSDVGVDYDGHPDVGESIFYTPTVRNLGTGIAADVTAVLRNHDGLGSVIDSTSAFGTLASGQAAAGDAVSVYVDDLAARFELLVYTGATLAQTRWIDLVRPDAPIGVVTRGAATSILVQWRKSAAADLLGYNVYRSTAAAGPYTRINPTPTDRVAQFDDVGLAALTRYYYRIASVDSSGNESPQSQTASSSTNPPTHGIFPVPMGQPTPSSVALDHLYPGWPIDIVAGADKLYVWHHDGTAPRDADGAGSTSGDFSTRGLYFAAAPGIADLDGNGSKEIVAASWDSLRVYTFDLAGNVRPGWPVRTTEAVWSSPAIGDLDNDGQSEIVWASNNASFYAVRQNGTELIDGDGNPSTLGVFKVLGSWYNFGTPAIADLDGNGANDIVFGSADGKLYAWRANGTNLPGFPVTIGASISGSVAIGHLDGPGDPQLDIVVPASNESLYVFRADGSRRPGFPRRVIHTGTSRSSSPALADMNNDGVLDVVQAGTNGRIYAYDGSGAVLPLWNGVPYSPLTGSATESSPVVADINGDGWNDIVMGDETGSLTALSGLDASVLPGFPIQLGAEVRGSAGLCDCDADGKTEIVLSGWDKNLYAWDYDFPFSPNGPPPWPQFHHDARRTGLSTSPVFVDVPGPPVAADAPVALEFRSPWPNPARRGVRLALAIPAASAGASFDLGVFDLAGRRVATVAAGTLRPGPLSLEWNLRGGDGAPVGEGVYFVRFAAPGHTLSQKLVVLR